MRDVHIIPKGRDKKAKMCYLFMDWVLRKNRHKIRKEVMDKMMDWMLYGKGLEEHRLKGER